MKAENLKSGALGFLLAACLFLLMGQKSSEQSSGCGRYQPVTNDTMLYVMDTATGATKFVVGLPTVKAYWGKTFEEIDNYPQPREPKNP
jgi:hypothetical protein